MMARLFDNFHFNDGMHELLHNVARVQSIGDFVFFRLILKYLETRIDDFGLKFMENMMAWVGGIALTLMTIWVLIQGFRIVTGRSRESMMALVTDMARAALIVSVATSMGMFGQQVHTFLATDVKNKISHVVTNSDDTPEKQIDDALMWMQVAMSSIDAIDVVGDSTLDGQKTRALTMVAVGTGGPAVVGGSMLLLYQIALALFIGLAPLFILCLLFDQTKALFQRWLFYGIGTMFSMAVLAVMVTIAMDMVIRVAGAFWATALIDQFLLNGDLSDGITSQALQQGGMGIILTTLIITAPPMAAMFFQGTLGMFAAYSQISGGAAATPSADGRPPGTYTPAPEVQEKSSPTTWQVSNAGGSGVPPAPTGQRGAARDAS